MAVKAKEKLNNVEPKVKETPAPIPEEGKEAETPAQPADTKMSFHLPKPSETKAGQWLKKHIVGFAIGAGAVIVTAIAAYAKGSTDALEAAADPDLDASDDEVIDVDAVEVEDENEE